MLILTNKLCLGFINRTENTNNASAALITYNHQGRLSLFYNNKRIYRTGNHKYIYIYIICTDNYQYYNTTSAVYIRLYVNRYMVKHYEALGLLTTPVYFFALPTHVTTLISTGLFIIRY